MILSYEVDINKELLAFYNRFQKQKSKSPFVISPELNLYKNRDKSIIVAKLDSFISDNILLYGVIVGLGLFFIFNWSWTWYGIGFFGTLLFLQSRFFMGLVFRLGLRKQAYKGKIKRISLEDVSRFLMEV